MISVTEAQQAIKSFARSFGEEEVEIISSLERVLVEDIHADRNYPPFNRSAMDGYAINSSDMTRFKEFKLTGELYAGSSPDLKVEEGSCIKIMTGAALPLGADAVIRVEDSVSENGNIRFLLTGVKPWANVAREGEDCLKGDLLIQKNEIISAAILSVLAVTGKVKVKVFKLPKIGIISTGDEVKPVDAPILPFQIRDSNSYGLSGFLNHYKIPVVWKALVPDNKQMIREAIETGLENDILILSGGVSMGDADFVPEVLLSCGVTKVFHKVSIKPGKPLWFGTTKDHKAVFALPGNPMSVQVAFKLFIEPYLRECFTLKNFPTLVLPLLSFRKKRTKLDEFFPCRLIERNGITYLDEVLINGSGDISSTINSDGLALHPSEKSDLSNDSLVKFIPWRMGI